MKTVCSITLLYSSTFYSFFLPFFVLEIFKFKYDTFFIRNSAAISKFDLNSHAMAVMTGPILEIKGSIRWLLERVLPNAITKGISFSKKY